MYYQLGVVSLRQQHGNLGGHGITMKVIGGGGETLLSVIRLCKMNIISTVVLNMSESLHQIIPYPLKSKWRGDLKIKS